METVWHLLSPVGVQREHTGARRSFAEGSDRVVGFLSNRKPHASLLLKTIMKRLQDKGYDTRFYEKLNAATPAAAQLLERIAKECTSVIVASGDWGGCTSWCIHDSVQLERQGLQAATICTTPFLTLGHAQAKTLNAGAQFTIAEIAHPLGATGEAEVKERADAAWPQLEKWLNAHDITA